jgi:hypothetical protein
MKTHLVNFPRRSPEELDSNLSWIGVKVNGQMIYSSYYTEAKDRKKAAKQAEKLLRNLP